MEFRIPDEYLRAPGPDGRDWAVYHAWNAARTARQMCVDPLRWWARAGPRVTPTVTPSRRRARPNAKG